MIRNDGGQLVKVASTTAVVDVLGELAFVVCGVPLGVPFALLDVSPGLASVLDAPAGSVFVLPGVPSEFALLALVVPCGVASVLLEVAPSLEVSLPDEPDVLASVLRGAT